MKNKIEYNGVLYNSYKELCDAYGINYKTFTDRQYKRWSFEECIKGRRRKHHIISYNGVSYNSEKLMCEELGVNYNNYSCRKYKGWSLEECISGKYDQEKYLKLLLQMIANNTIKENISQLPANMIKLLIEYNYIKLEDIDKKIVKRKRIK